MSTQENLLSLLNLPPRLFSAVVRTSDGHYIAQRRGDLGYNHFLGSPAPVHEGPGLSRTRAVWATLTAEEQAAVRAFAARPVDGSPIDLAQFGIPDADLHPTEVA